MQARGANNEAANNQLWMVFGVIFFIGFIIAAIWYSAQSILIAIAVSMADQSLSILDGIYQFLLSIHSPAFIINFFVPDTLLKDAARIDNLIVNSQTGVVQFGDFIDLLGVSALVLRLLCIPMFIVSLYYVIKRSKAGRLTRVMNIFSLSRLSMEQFPQIRPAVIEDLIKQHPDEGYYRREISPMRFALKHELLTAYKTNFKEELLPEKVTPTFNQEHQKNPAYEVVQDDYAKGISKLHNRCLLDKEKTAMVFIEQLGDLWSGSHNLPPFVRGLYAAFIAFAAADKDASFKLLDQFNRTWQPPTKKKLSASIDLSGVDKMIEKYESAEVVQDILSKHAYVRTIMARLLEAARKKGRLSSSLFLWVKVIDRTLWYTLSQEGGQCAWTEAAGPRAHKLAEKSVKGPIYKPCINAAVTEFESYLCFTEGWIPLAKDRPDMSGA